MHQKLLLRVFLILSLALISCKKEALETVRYFNNPSGPFSSEPNLHKAEDGSIYLSWIEAKKNENSKLFFVTLANDDETTQQPQLIAEGKDWFVNWADFPSITSFGKNSLAAHYLDKSSDDTYAYDVKLTLSNNKGSTWSPAIIPHKDKTNTEHGFVSKVAINEDELLSVWLDGRKYAYSENDTTVLKEMTLRAAILNEKGALLQEFELDGRVCDCCQTDTALTQNGAIVVYRDRSDTEIRDISYVRQVNGAWTEPKSIYDDNWSIFGCPVNGPAIATSDNVVAVVWFTNANEDAEVKVAFSDNNGETFKMPLIVDQIKPSGRVDIELLKDNSALVSWLDNIGEKAVIQVQRIYATGEKSPVVSVAESSESRSSGFPRMILKDELAYLAWTNAADTLTVKTAIINTSDIKK